jgi:hypothetical protein
MELVPKGEALQILTLALNGFQARCQAVAMAFDPSGLPAQLPEAADLEVKLGA